MRHLTRSVLIGTLALTATALAGVNLNQGGIGNVNAGQQGGQLSIDDQFALAFPGGQLLKNGGQLRRVWGRQFSWGTSPTDEIGRAHV